VINAIHSGDDGGGRANNGRTPLSPCGSSAHNRRGAEATQWRRLRRNSAFVGGGPAPGVNSVISAATIRTNLDGVAVIGIEEGFKWLMQGDISHAR
jgi:hypothetical protein